MARDPLPLPALEQIIWNLLEEYPGHRPTIAQVAARAGMTPIQMRRTYERLNRLIHDRLSQSDGASFRNVLSYCCVSHAARDIGRAVKIDAARELAGFRQKTSFIRDFRDFFGCSPREFRDSGKTYEGQQDTETDHASAPVAHPKPGTLPDGP